MRTETETRRMSDARATESSDESLATAVGRIAARLDRLPSSWTVWKFIILLSFGFFFELYDLLYSGYVVPGLIRSGIFTATTAGLLGLTGIASFIAFLFLGLFVGTLGCGFLADKFGRRSIFTYSLLFYTAANLVMAFQNTAAGANFWRFMAGLGIGVELVTIDAYISELVPKHVRGRAFAFSQMLGFTSVPVVALLAYLLVPRKPLGLDGWRWVVLIGAHGALFIWFIRRALPESPRWLAEKGRLAEAENVLSQIEAKVQREYGGELPSPASPEILVARRTFRDVGMPPFRKRTVMLVIFNIFQTFGYYGFANWVPTLLLEQGITITASMFYSFVIAIAAPMGPMIGLVTADRFERRTVIVASAGFITAFGLLFSHSSNGLLLIAVGAGLTLANNTLSYSFHAYQAELYPTSIRASAVGFVYSWSRFSAIFTSFFIAGILRAFGTTGVFASIAAAMLIVMLTIGLLGPNTLDLGLEKISQ